MSLVDSDDEFPNDFDGLDFSAVPGLQDQHHRLIELQPAATVPSNRSHSSGSTSIQRTGVVVSPIVEFDHASPARLDSSDGFELDSSTLAAIDEIEARALQKQQIVGSSGVQQVSSSVCPNGTTEAPPLPCGKKRHLGEDDVVGSPPIIAPSVRASLRDKGKAKLDCEQTLQGILEGYEDEMTCPICCDMLAAAFMTNPCGHTTCGDCGYGWISRNKYSPTCPVCRSELIKIKPLLPNYAVDNLVKHHVHSLAMSGRPEWQQRGFKFIEWNKRLDTWKKQYTMILAEENARGAARKRRYQSHYFEDDPPWLPVEEFIAPHAASSRPRRSTRRT